MRTSAIWFVLASSAALASSACSSAQLKELKKEVIADVKQAAEIKKGIDAAKKGDVNAIADTATESAVKAALAKNEKTRSAGIEVDAKNGVVTLKGKTDAATSAEAEKVAKAVPGVTKVELELDGKSKPKSKADKGDAHDARDAHDAKDAKTTTDPKAGTDHARK